MRILFGFSTGCLYKTDLGLKEKIRLIKNNDCNTIELGFLRAEDLLEGANTLRDIDLKDFEYVSLHAPTKWDGKPFAYQNDYPTHQLFTCIDILHKIAGLNLVVFHPDRVMDFEVFADLPFPVAFENMDSRKPLWKTPEDIERVLAKNKYFRVVLDLNHAFSNGQKMDIALEFYEKLGNKIAQIHLSGYTGYHEPLFKTKQLEIIEAIKDYTLPIIVESVLNKHDIKKEKDFILKYMHF